MKEYQIGTGAAYPKLRQIKQNSYYQGLLQNLYASSDGELYSFMQFTYQSFMLSPFGVAEGNVFASLAEEELLHAKQLAEGIILLGGDPIFCGTQGKWLGGRAVDYVKGLRQMLDLNIEHKEKSIIDYKTTILKIDEPQIKSMLTSILSQEESHLYKLKEIYRSLKE